jgi:hypothetical protein
MEGGSEMAAIQKLSAQMIDYAERLSGMADAAEGKHVRRGSMRRWIALPASGAALYAVVRSDFFSRQAKEVIDEARSRASELPDDLVTRIRETVEEPSAGNGSRSSKRSTRGRSTRKAGSTRKAKTGAR